jgi:hypothetical protein
MNYKKAVTLPWHPEIAVYCRGKNVLRVLMALGKKHAWMSFEPLGIFH